MFGAAFDGMPGGAIGGPDVMSFLNNPALMNMVCLIDDEKEKLSLVFFRQCNLYKILKCKDCKIFEFL